MLLPVGLLLVSTIDSPFVAVPPAVAVLVGLPVLLPPQLPVLVAF